MIWISMCLGILSLWPHPSKSEVIPGLPYERFEIKDPTDARITLYVTHPDQPSLLVVFIPGAGCDLIIERNEKGKYEGEIAVMMNRAARGRVSLLTVETPFGISINNISENQIATDVGCPVQFLRQNTLENRAVQFQAAIAFAEKLPWVKPGPILILGRGDGGSVASIIARNNPNISHTGLITPDGAPGAWNGLKAIIGNKQNEHSLINDLNESDATINDIINNPDRIDKWSGHFTYKYAASKIRVFSTDNMIHSVSKTYILEAVHDTGEYSDVLSTEYMVSALRTQPREVVVRRVSTVSNDHSLEEFDRLTSEFSRIIDWFLDDIAKTPAH
jgi:hypothetical protein